MVKKSSKGTSPYFATLILFKNDALPPGNIMLLEPDFGPIRDSEWFREIVKTTNAPRTGSNNAYDLLKSSLIGGGFSVRKISDFLKFALCNVLHFAS